MKLMLEQLDNILGHAACSWTTHDAGHINSRELH